MAIITYGTRAGGFWLMGHIDVSKRGRIWLQALPGAIVISIIAPEIASGSVPEWVAAIAALVVAIRTDNILLAILAGIGTVYVLRTTSLIALLVSF